MNPFDQPPTEPPVSLEPPTPLIQQAPRRGRMVVVAVAAAGLMGAGLIGISQFASADQPEITPSASGETLAVPSLTTEQPDGDHDGDHGPFVDGQIVIDNGDGEPIVIDLGEGTVNGESLEQFGGCVGLPMFGDGTMFDFEDGEFPFGEMEGMFEDGEFPFEDLEGMLEDFPFEDFEGILEEFGEFEDFGAMGDFGMFDTDGTHVSVLGPDGLSVIELGDGDGSVTITQEGGEITIDANGSATVSELDEMFGEMGFPDLESLDIEQMFEDFDPESFEGFEFEIPSEIQDCLDAIDNG